MNELTNQMDNELGYINALYNLPRVLDSIGAGSIKKQSKTRTALAGFLEKASDISLPVNEDNELRIYQSLGRLAEFVDSTDFAYERMLTIILLYETYHKLSDIYIKKYNQTWRRFRDDELTGTEATRIAHTYDQKANLMTKAMALMYGTAVANLEPGIDDNTRYEAWKFLYNAADDFPEGAIVQQLEIYEKLKKLSKLEKHEKSQFFANKTVSYIETQQKKHPDKVGIARRTQMPGKDILVLPFQSGSR
ncbi:MAG: hypothetical protein GF307_01820 [candidate division Zixibacteria bacterium]|nr:hypothetical protein [candidate division Zixibacteria bacterium]